MLITRSGVLALQSMSTKHSLFASQLTRSFTVPATPVVHTPPATPMYHPDAAGPTVPSFHYDYDSGFDSRVLSLPFSLDDVTNALRSYRNRRRFTVPSFDVTDFGIFMTIFAMLSLQFFCTICFADYMLPFKLAIELFRGFCAVSLHPQFHCLIGISNNLFM